MKTNLLQRKRLLTEESNRCYLCDAPVCTKACKPGLDPGRLLRACKMDNLAGAILRAYRMEACKDCDGHPCEKPASRTNRPGDIHHSIVRQLQDMPNPTDSSPLTSSPDLAIDFCGVRCANPFILASSPVAIITRCASGPSKPVGPVSASRRYHSIRAMRYPPASTKWRWMACLSSDSRTWNNCRKPLSKRISILSIASSNAILTN